MMLVIQTLDLARSISPVSPSSIHVLVSTHKLPARKAAEISTLRNVDN